MKRTINVPAAAFAGLVTTGLLALPISTAFADDDVDAKRDDDSTELVVVADDGDDGDDGPDGLAGTNTGSGGGDTSSRYTSGVDSNDNTGSGSTAVSRDRDRSRGDKTKDFTRDGGDRTRDWSANRTNDRSRNDTRG